jgi:hypothetical protein
VPDGVEPEAGNGDAPSSVEEQGDGTDPQGDQQGSGDDAGTDENDCSSSDLRPGRTVREAALEISADGAVFDAVEVVV